MSVLGLLEVLTATNIDVSTATRTLLSQRQERRKDDALRKKSVAYKVVRRSNKEKNKVLHTSVDNSQYSYKNLQEERPKNKKRKAEESVETHKKKKRKQAVCKICGYPVTKEYYTWDKRNRYCKNASK